MNTSTAKPYDWDRVTTCPRLVILFPTKHLGNFLLAVKTLETVMAARHELGLATHLAALPVFANLLPDNLAGLERLDYPGEAGRGSNLWQRTQAWLGFLGKLRRLRADVLVDLEGTPRSANIARWAGAGLTVVRKRPKKPARGFDLELAVHGEGIHACQEFAAMFRMPADVAGEPAYGTLAHPDALWRELSARFDVLAPADTPLIAIHTGATKDYKMWPLEQFIALVERCQASGYRVVLLGAGARDAACNQQINAALATPVTDLCNQLSLAELAVVLKHVNAYVGNDSGPAHLAGTMGAPAVIVFGPTDLSLWGPASAQSVVVTEHCPCAPDRRKAHCSNELVCIRGITVDTVWEQLSLHLQP